MASAHSRYVLELYSKILPDFEGFCAEDLGVGLTKTLPHARTYVWHPELPGGRRAHHRVVLVSSLESLHDGSRPPADAVPADMRFKANDHLVVPPQLYRALREGTLGEAPPKDGPPADLLAQSLGEPMHRTSLMASRYASAAVKSAMANLALYLAKRHEGVVWEEGSARLLSPRRDVALDALCQEWVRERMQDPSV